jgi:hypothetical protein
MLEYTEESLLKYKKMETTSYKACFPGTSVPVGNHDKREVLGLSNFTHWDPKITLSLKSPIKEVALVCRESQTLTKSSRTGGLGRACFCAQGDSAGSPVSGLGWRAAL